MLSSRPEFRIHPNILITFLIVFASVSSAFSQATIDSDDNGMKQYFFVVLVKGENRSQDSVTVAQIQKGHLENIDRLYKEGKIDLAGPFLDDTDWRGIFVFNVATEAEVKSLLQSDPAIESGRLKYIIHPWYSQKGAMLR
ncbi:MAG: hypothetical protein KA444_07905 [Bacteroidia bacterium]|nr:hypothetical protein [Bacteroidia bacterium]